MTNGSNKGGDALAAFLLGLIGGAIGAYLLKKVLEDVPASCPECGEPLREGVIRCPHCGIEVEWD